MNTLEAVIYFAVHAKNLELDGLPLTALFGDGSTVCQPEISKQQRNTTFVLDMLVLFSPRKATT